jgi:CHAT domain
MVVLSSCDLGLTDVRPGDETFGMVTALLTAGAGTVVASVARVADDTAMATMAGYHQAAAAGRGIRSELRHLPEPGRPALRMRYIERHPRQAPARIETAGIPALSAVRPGDRELDLKGSKPRRRYLPAGLSSPPFSDRPAQS